MTKAKNRVVPAKFSKLGAFLGFAALTAGAALSGALSTRHADGPWYKSLRKPALQPPPEIFGPVWSVLYGLIAYSGYRVYAQPSSPARTRALALWATQLGLNALWTPLFFGAHEGRAALVDSAALTGTIGAYVGSAWQVDGRAAAAMAPYLVWSSFATYLNEELVRRNPRFLVG